MSTMNDLVEIRRADLERLLSLGRQVSAILEIGPSWVSAGDDADAREFDPTKDAAAFARFMKTHPNARTHFMFQLTGEQTSALHTISRDLATVVGSAKQEATPEVDAPDEVPESVPQTDSALFAAISGGEQVDPQLISEMDALAVDAHQQALREVGDDTQLGCTECGRPNLERVTEMSGVHLPKTDPKRPRVESVMIVRLKCGHCGHTEETPRSSAVRRQAYGKLLAQRMLLDQPIDRTDLYDGVGEIYAQMLYSSRLLLEFLQELVEVIHNPDGSSFDDEGVFTGHFVMNPQDEFEVELFEQLEAVGMIICVGGLLYKAVPASEQPVNPFAATMLQVSEPAPGGALH